MEKRNLKIYDSFEALMQQNKGVFKRFSKSRYQGIFKAIWEARQSEIDGNQKSIRYLFKKFKFTQDEGIALKKETLEQQAYISKLERELKISIADVKKFAGFSQVLESAISVAQSKLNQEIETNKMLSQQIDSERKRSNDHINENEYLMLENKDMKRWTGEMEQKDHQSKVNNKVLRDECHNLIIEESKYLERERELNEKLNDNERELSEALANIRQYKTINYKMSDELFRVNGKFDRLSAEISLKQ